MSTKKSEESKPRPLLGTAIFISTMGVVATLATVDTISDNGLAGGSVALAGLAVMALMAFISNFLAFRREQATIPQAEHQTA